MDSENENSRSERILDSHEEEELVAELGYDEANSDDVWQKAQTAAWMVWRGLWKLVQILMYLFVAFSVWFTVRTALCSLVDVNPNKGCNSSLRDAVLQWFRRSRWIHHCYSCDVQDFFHRSRESMLGYLPTIPQWLLALGQPMMDFWKAVAVMAGIYWARFWCVQTYRKELDRDRLMDLVGHLKEVTLDQAEEFRTYMLVIWASAVVFATVFFPLCWMIRLQDLHDGSERQFTSCQAEVDGYDCGPANLDSWTTVALEEFWKLFMSHFISSALVADIAFNTGPLLNWWTVNEQGFPLYVGGSILLSAFVYPLGAVSVWWWTGSVVG